MVMHNGPWAPSLSLIKTISYISSSDLGSQGPEVQILSPRPKIPLLFNSLHRATATTVLLRARSCEICVTRHTQDSIRPSRAHFLRRLDQPRDVRRRVMRRDSLGLMAEQILTILKADAGCTQPMTEGVAKVVHANAR